MISFTLISIVRLQTVFIYVEVVYTSRWRKELQKNTSLVVIRHYNIYRDNALPWLL